jgi:hypothetical protein
MILINILFIAVMASIFLFLWYAPKETTPTLPHDQQHQPLFAIASKKEAEKQCSLCHAPEMVAPLPAAHPDGNRCLFCHKRR